MTETDSTMMEFTKTGTEYNSDGDDRDGYDREGFNSDGDDRDGYDRDGLNQSGWTRDGYDKDGFNAGGIHEETGTEYDSSGRNKYGIDEEGFDLAGRDSKGYDKTGRDRFGNKREDNLIKTEAEKEFTDNCIVNHFEEEAETGLNEDGDNYDDD